jgi:Right handed beta helix region
MLTSVRTTPRPLVRSLVVGALVALSVSTLPPIATQAAEEQSRARKLVVSTHGRDSAAGTPAAPLRTIGAAISRAGSGSTIVVRGGQYHESLTVPSGKRLTIEAAPGARVWLEGSRPVQRWRPTSNGFVHRGWRASFDSSPTYHWGAPDGTEPGWSFVNDRRPMAAHPDQVWVGGVAQRQVSSRSRLERGTFYVDDPGNRLYLGSNPAGRTVRASTLDTALAIRAAGTSIRGIGVRRYAPSVPHMGAVTVEARDVTLDRVAVLSNATTGVHVSGAGAVLRRVRLTANGMLGLSATYADGLRLLRVRSQGNNVEGFNQAPVAGGIKVGRTSGVRVVGATVTGNDGTGLWFDESTRRIRVYDSTIRNNGHHGISLEISADARVADTVIAGNRDDGIKVNDTSDVMLWNNTIVGNGRPVNIVQDDRDASDPDTPGHDPRQPVPAPGMTWINERVQVHNNILGRGRADANCLLCVEDYSGRFSAAELRVRASGNVYVRANRSAPTWVVVWSRGAGDPAVFTSLRDFARATGQEQPHLGIVGRRAVNRDLRATAQVRRATDRVARPLPATLARALERAPGVRHLGAWVG